MIPYPKTIRYPSDPEIRLPESPPVEIRDSGWFGKNGQDAGHARRMREIQYIGEEISYTGLMGACLEVKGIRDVTNAVRQAENMVYSIPEDRVAGMLAADMTSDMTARRRLQHSRLMELFDAETMNLIDRR